MTFLALALRSKAQVSESQQPSCEVQKGGTLKKPTQEQAEREESASLAALWPGHGISLLEKGIQKMVLAFHVMLTSQPVTLSSTLATHSNTVVNAANSTITGTLV
jgi:hypothetical protein